MTTKQTTEQKMEWVILEKIWLNGLSLKDVQEVIAKKLEKHGEDAVLEISSSTQTNYSYREDDSYTTSHSNCHIKKLMPALSQEEKDKRYADNRKEIQEKLQKALQSANLVSSKK